MSGCGHPEARRALQSLFLGELEAQALTRLRAHAVDCAPCREAYDRLARVESALEGRALPAARQALLEQEVLARLEQPVRRAAQAPQPRMAPVWLRPMVLGLAAASVLLAVVAPRLLPPREPEWQARGGQSTGNSTGNSTDSVWGVRAFCIGPDGQVRGEARPGARLACMQGGAVQFSYTAPQGARLEVAGTTDSGELVPLFPSEGPPAAVAAGVDVLLPYSTLVQGDWLSAPLRVRARFTDAGGRLLSETQVTLEPEEAAPTGR